MIERITDTFREQINGMIEKIPYLIEGTIVLIFFVLIAHFVRRLAAKRLEKKTEDVLRAQFIARIINGIIILIGLMLAMNAAGYGDVAAGLMAGAGVSAFVVGFALKDIGENFLAGFLLSFSRPFRINDTIEVDNIKGKVRALNLRNTHVKTSDGKDIFIPNASLIKGNLQNFTLDGFLRQEYVIGISYDADLKQAREVLRKVVDAHTGIAKNHNASIVMFDSLGPSTYNVKVLYWLDMFDSSISGSRVKTELVEQSLLQLAEAGIDTPGNQLELKPIKMEQVSAN